MLVYNCRPSDAVSIKTSDNDLRVIVDTILNKQSAKQVQLRFKSKDTENFYTMRPEDSFTVKVGDSRLEVRVGHTSPTKTTLYVGSLDDAMFRFIKGSSV